MASKAVLMHYNTLIEKSCLKGTVIEQQWDNPACKKAASKLQLYHSLVVNTLEYLI